MNVDKIRGICCDPRITPVMIVTDPLIVPQSRAKFVWYDAPPEPKVDEVIPIPLQRRYIDPKEVEKAERKRYWKEVWQLTEAIAPEIPGIEKRGFKDHHIDHIVSVWFGYKNNIQPAKIADLSNLRMLPYKENMRKGTKCG